MNLRKEERRGKKGEKKRRRMVGWEVKEGGKEAGREEGERVGRNDFSLVLQC